MQVNGLESVKMAMEMEPPAQKVRLVIGTVTHFLMAAAIAIFFFVWMVNVNNI